MIRHVVSNVRHVPEVLLHCPVVVAVLTPVFGSFKVVVARRAVAVSTGFTAVRYHFLNPPFFCFGGAVKGVNIVLAGEVDALGNVFTLAIENLSLIHI